MVDSIVFVTFEERLASGNNVPCDIILSRLSSFCRLMIRRLRMVVVIAHTKLFTSFEEVPNNRKRCYVQNCEEHVVRFLECGCCEIDGSESCYSLRAFQYL